MASIRKRGTTWRAEVRIKGFSVSDSFGTKGEANDWALEQERKIRAGLGFSVHKRVVADALERYRLEVSVHKDGKKWETNRLLAFERDAKLAQVALADIDQSHMSAWRERRLLSVQGSTVNREFNLLSHVFMKALDEWKWVQRNPCHKVARCKDNPHRTRRVSEDELRLIYTVCGLSTETIAGRVALAFEFAIETAMRGGEIIRLNAESRRPGNIVHLPKTKNGDARNVPLSERAAEILDMFPKGFGLTDAQKESNFRIARNKACLPDLNFHDSRHEAICRLAKVMDVLDLARIVGHRNINELLTYYHADAPALATQIRERQASALATKALRAATRTTA